MKSNLIKNLDYKNLVLTILVTLLVFTFSLKINKHLKMFFLLISLFICIYDLRYLIPFLVTFLIINLSCKKNVEHFSSREDFNSLVNNKNKDDDNTTAKRRNFLKEMKKIPFFSEDELINNLFNQIIILRTTNSDITTFANSSDDNKRIIFNRIINKVDPKPSILFDILLLDENDLINVNRIGIINILDGRDDSILKKMGLLFTVSSKNNFYNFMYKISKQIGLSELFNRNLSPIKPRTQNLTPEKRNIINNNFNYSQNRFDSKRKKLLQAIIFLFKENMSSDVSINDLIINEKTEDLFDYDFSIENYLEDKDRLNNTFFLNLGNILSFDFNVFRSEFLITDLTGKNSITDKLTHFYRQNQSITDKRILKGDFEKVKNDVDNTHRRPIIDKVNSYITRYQSDIDIVVEELSLLDNILRPIRDNQLKNTEKLKILSNMYSIIFLSNNDFSSKFNTAISINEMDNKLIQNFNDKRDTIENKVDNQNFELNTNDIFYNQIFLYIKINNSSNDFFIQNIFEEVIVPSFDVPSVSLDQDSSWYEESELKKFFDVNEMNDKKENELEKYYRAMDFNNPNLHEISKQATIQNSNKKIEEVSFNKVVDNFSKDTYNIIDKMSDLITESIRKDSFDFKEFISSFINILTEEDRELSIGFIFICLGILIYFMEESSPRNEVNIVDYLSQIKI
jgi:hypothetical protein